jgi:hypothetical protein
MEFLQKYVEYVSKNKLLIYGENLLTINNETMKGFHHVKR